MRALIIDDDPNARALLERALAGDFDKIDSASTGAEALALVAEDVPDAIVQDLRLPDDDDGLSGMQLFWRLRHLCGPHVTIVVISGHPAELYQAARPPDSILPKPFTADAIRGVVAAAMRDTQERAVPPVNGNGNGNGAKVAAPPQTRPAWMVFLGLALLIGGPVLQWQADFPASVWAVMMVAGAILLWTGPMPSEAWSALARAAGRFLKK